MSALPPLPAVPAASPADAATLEQIAATVGTPAYVYGADAIQAAYRQLDAAFGDAPHAIHYAMKANSSLAIVRLVRALGSARRCQLHGRSGRRASLRLHPGRDRVHRGRQERRANWSAPWR